MSPAAETERTAQAVHDAHQQRLQHNKQASMRQHAWEALQACQAAGNSKAAACAPLIRALAVKEGQLKELKDAEAEITPDLIVAHAHTLAAIGLLSDASIPAQGSTQAGAAAAPARQPGSSDQIPKLVAAWRLWSVQAQVHR